MTPYDQILIDPPWRWKNYNSTERATRGEKWGRARARPPYDCLDDEDLMALPIADLCHKDTVLYCWAVEPKQELAYQVMRAWGFTPVTTVFTWIKLTRQAFRNYEQWQQEGRDLQWILDHLFHVGSGFWTRANPEGVLLGRRKGGRQGDIKRNLRELVVTPVGPHSVKPAEVHRRIERLHGAGRRLEVFGRRRERGWDVIGYDYDGLDIRESIRRLVAGDPLPGVGQHPVTRGPLSPHQESILQHLFRRWQKGWGLVWKPADGQPRWTNADRASVSRSLARLESRGLVRRINHSGRTTHVELTDRGLMLGHRLTTTEDVKEDG